MSQVANLNSFGANLSSFHEFCLMHLVDPFAEEVQDVSQSNYVHIRVQLRSGKKCLTTLQGLNPDFDFKKILKAFKKV